jgi:dihydrofolate synthase / folylpolyglutamate synthase
MSQAPSTSPKSRQRTRTRRKTDKNTTPKFENYTAALRHLGSLTNFETTRARRLHPELLTLDRMRALLGKLGDPQDQFKSVHVAGTKGKGSTCAMLDCALRASGYTVGLYTSPHLMDVRERIQISGQLIPHPAFTDLLQQVVDAAAKLPARHRDVTYFEALTAMAFLRFAEQAVDVAVIETGLGGRLDATNVITPEVSVITAIGYDHMQILGNTLGAIAREKAGIIKPGVPVITIQQPEEAIDAISEVADERGSELRVLARDIEFSYRFEASPKLGPHTCVCLSTSRVAFEHVSVPLPGEHQALNCGLALAAIDRLSERGFTLRETSMIESLEEVTLAGRMELISSSPRVLIDGAHNPESLKALMRSIGAHVPYDSMVVIFGCAEDKDIDGLLREISLGADKVVFTRARANQRAMDPEELAKRFAEVSGRMSQTAPDYPAALETAQQAVGREDLICVTGSFVLAGEAKKHAARAAAL